MFMQWDEDEWESVTTSQSYGKFHGIEMGSLSHCWRRREPEEIARIKAEKRRLHEDAVLAEADAIRARRSAVLVA